MFSVSFCANENCSNYNIYKVLMVLSDGVQFIKIIKITFTHFAGMPDYTADWWALDCHSAKTWCLEALCGISRGGGDRQGCRVEKGGGRANANLHPAAREMILRSNARAGISSRAATCGKITSRGNKNWRRSVAFGGPECLYVLLLPWELQRAQESAVRHLLVFAERQCLVRDYIQATTSPLPGNRETWNPTGFLAPF